MEQSLSRQAAYIEHSVGKSSENIERAVSELADRTGASSDALEAQAETLRQMSSGMLNQIQSLTKRFEEQGATIMKSAKALEVSNTRVDGVMEQRQAQLGKLIETIGQRASELDKMMHNYSSMLEESLSRAENRARDVTEMLAHDSAEKSQSAVREIEKLRTETQAQTFEAIEELKSRFATLSEQIGDQLNTLTSRFSETSETVKDSTRRASMDLESTNSELRRQAKAIPETTRESATAMRKALQDQLAALDSLSDIANRHRYSAAVSRGDEAAPRSGGEPSAPPRKEGGDYRSAPSQPAATRQRNRDDEGWPTQHGAPAKLPKRPSWNEEAAPSGRRDRAASRADDEFSALTAGLIERLEGKPTKQRDEDERFGAEQEPPARQSRGAPSARQPAPPQAQEEEAAAKPAGEWSLGDLLARASEAEEDDELSLDDGGFGANSSFGDDDHSYGRPPQMAPEPAPRQEKPAPQDDRADFNMKDIADAVDQDTVVEVWKRYHRGDRSVISRDVYNRQGQSTFDQVQRRYRNDTAFRHIADRYMADFEKVLKDASQSGQDSKALQNYLVSETGKIYLMLAHASGRLD
jgi:F0F1-type ATP synthase membrane subunit b/b'